MNDFDRYGTVNVNEQGFVISFEEKIFKNQGLINGGIYLLDKDIFKDFALQEKFSFEEFLQENYEKLKAKAHIFDDYFIDIGVPEDYRFFIILRYDSTLFFNSFSVVIISSLYPFSLKELIISFSYKGAAMIIASRSLKFFIFGS